MDKLKQGGFGGAKMFTADDLKNQVDTNHFIL